MDTSKKIIRGVVNSRGFTITSPITQWDYGWQFIPEIEDLPATYRLDFSNGEHHGTALPVYCSTDGAEVPTELIDTGKDVWVWLFNIGEGYGITEYKWRIPNKCKPKTEQDEPTPSQQSSIDQAISALNEAVEQTSQDVQTTTTNAAEAQRHAEEADQSSQSAKEDADRAEQAKEDASTFAQRSANSAQASADYSESAQASATASANSASQSAQIKADVEDLADDAQSYAQSAEQSAQNAHTYALSANAASGTAENFADVASGYASQAQSSAQTASAKAQDASQSATTASQKATESAQSASQASGYAQTAESAKTDAQTAQGKAEDAQTAAETAQGLAEDARDEAQTLVDSITGKVEQIDSNTERIESLEDDRYKPYPTDTASGAIASFTDGADDLPLKSLVVDINPVQDLHGQDAPYPAGGGNNILPYPYKSSDGVYNGITITTKSDGTIHAQGTNTSNVIYFWLYDSNVIPSWVVAGETYGLRPVASSGKYFLQALLYGSPIFVLGGNEAPKAFPNDLSVYTRFAICIGFYSGAVVDDDIQPIFFKGSTVPSWSPYENICPISGWTEVDVEQSGVNVWDEEWELGYINPNNGNNASSNNCIRSKNYIRVKPNVAYYFKCPNATGVNIKIAQYDANKGYISPLITKANDAVIMASNCQYIRFFASDPYGATYNHDISINYPSTDHSYHPYTGRSIAINLGQTVYGGKLDVLSGVLTVDRKYEIFDGSADEIWYTYSSTGYRVPKRDIGLSESGICNLAPTVSSASTYGVMFSANAKYIYFFQAVSRWGVATIAELRAWLATNNVEVCYELATPLTIQLTPNQANSLLGVNNIWADSGDTTAEYRADTKLYINKKIAEAISALS